MEEIRLCKNLSWNQLFDLNLESINGIPISEIERRSRPIKLDSMGEPIYESPQEIFPKGELSEEKILEIEDSRNIRSVSGFLGPQESFVKCLQRDWKTVKDFGLTHIELANHLRRIITKFDEITENRRKERAVVIEKLKYHPSELENSSFNEPQLLIVKGIQTKGQHQYCLFTDLENTKNGIIAWKEEYHIISETLGIELRIGGNKQFGALNYIENWGFYQGSEGCNNIFRIDPSSLVAVLTGKWNQEAQLLEMKKVDSQRAVLKMKIDSFLKQKETIGKTIEILKNQENQSMDIKREIQDLIGEKLYIESMLEGLDGDLKMIEIRLEFLKQKG